LRAVHEIVVIGSGLVDYRCHPTTGTGASGDDRRKTDKPGGRAYVYEQDGFTFDAGPTIITAPYLIMNC
jgi:phytoene desaturase